MVFYTQGGGRDKLNTVAGNQPTVYMMLPMEVISSSQQIPVVKVNDLSMIPSAQQVRQAISNLYKKQEAAPDQFNYVKFPFGVLDYDGLQKIQEYHEHKLERKLQGEEREWLRGCELLCRNTGIDIAKIKQFFEAQVWNKSNARLCGRNFVEKRWISDSDMEVLFDIANKQHNDTICFVSGPNKHLYAFSQLQKKLETTTRNGIKIKRVLIALHVGSKDNGTTFVSHGSMQGNHWSLLAINVENRSAYYGDSLRWPVPQNLISALEENLRVLECKLGIDIHSCVQDIITIHQPCGGTHTCPEQGTSFYPLQTCSNVCGIIVMSMVAVMANSWEEWCKWTSLTAPEVLQNPSLHSTYLRINTLSWIVENKIDAATLNKFPSSSIKKVDSMPATLKCTPVQVNTGDILCRNNLPVIENSKPKTNAITGETWSDADDFIPPKKATKQDF